jgi:type IV pilus assembly protein PilY1
MFLGNGDGTFDPPYTFVTSLSSLQRNTWMSMAAAVYDYNGDGWNDLIWGAGTNSSFPSTMTTNGGDVLILINDKNPLAPKFVPSGKLLANAGYNYRGPNCLAFADFTGDGVGDLLVGGASSNRLRLHAGLLGGGVSAAPQSLTFGAGTAAEGAASIMLVGDFSLDGKLDFVVGSDNWNWTVTDGSSATNHIGGNAYYYQNDGDTQPFSGGYTSQISSHGDPHSAPNLFDFDTGFAIDYDHDPDRTIDFMVADGNHAGNYYLFANRPSTTYVSCGTVASGVLDIGALATQEMTVTEVRLDPTQTLNGGSIAWEASNDGGTTWHSMSPCADDAADYCVTFTNTVGNEIRWRANLCADATQTKTPLISGVGVSYSYVTADNHFRAGPIASDGLIYVGAFRSPGDAGRFYAVSDETGAVVWDASAILDGLGSRSIYTAAEDDTRLEFSTSSASDPLFQQTLLAPDAATASAIVTWQTSARFGLGSPQVLGGIESSTAALLTPPRPPYWYTDDDTSSAERALVDAYVTAYQTRPRLAFVGSKDGALHAIFTNPWNASDPDNGKEMWAFIPYDVAQRLDADRVSGAVTAYPDGSPTLASAKIGGAWRTVLVSGEANGGRYVYALDVTETIDPSTRAVNGPTPLWTFSDGNMGRTYSKPAVARIDDAGSERWLAIFGSGPGLTSDLGDTVYAVDLATGELVWRFDLDDANAYVATDVTVSETDDEAGTDIDGFADRVFFADNKGRVWKLDPAAHSGTSIDPVGSSIDVGLTHAALFTTKDTPGALGEERAIAGTLAAAEDPLDHELVLYFGTGGTEETSNSAQNAFYAVHAATGEIRNQFLPSAGVKFYGGIAVNDGQIILSSGSDLSGLGLCAPTAGEIVALDQVSFSSLFSIPVGSKIVSPVFVQRGEFYTVNLQGELVTSQYTGPATAYGASPPPPDTPPDADEPGEMTDPFLVLSWRQTQ